LSRQRARIVVGLDRFRCVPGFQRLSNAAVAFVNYLSIVKVDGMIKGPGMFLYIGAFSTLFSISDMFFSPCTERSFFRAFTESNDNSVRVKLDYFL